MSNYDSFTNDSAGPARSDAYADDVVSNGARPLFPWERLFYALGFGIVAWCVFWLLITLAVVQFILMLIQALTPAVTGHPSDELKRFNLRMLQYLLELLAYITFVRDQLPFPFSPFPVAPTRQPG